MKSHQARRTKLTAVSLIPRTGIETLRDEEYDGLVDEGELSYPLSSLR